MKDTRVQANELIHKLFDYLPVGKTCTWYGTTFDKNGDLLPCGEPTVGAGMFCDQLHILCEYQSVCERHVGEKHDWKDV